MGGSKHKIGYISLSVNFTKELCRKQVVELSRRILFTLYIFLVGSTIAEVFLFTSCAFG